MYNNKNNKEILIKRYSSYSWDIEWKRLKLLYSAKILISDNLINDDLLQTPSLPLTIKLILVPTDPEFPIELLNDETIINNNGLKGIPLSIYIPSDYPEGNINNILIEIYKYNNIFPNIKDIFLSSIKKFILTKSPIYETLKLLDKYLINLIKSNEINNIDNNIINFWNPKKQKLLEEALCYYKYTKDPKKKWDKIAKHVGDSITVQQCIQRYKYCRSLVNNKKNTEVYIKDISDNNISKISNIKDKDKNINDNNNNNNNNNNNKEYQINEITKYWDKLILNGLELNNIDFIIISTIQIQIYCNKCFEINHFKSLSIPNLYYEEENLKIQLPYNIILGNSQQCKKCSLNHTIKYKPLLCYINNPYSGHIEYLNCQIYNIIPINIIISCSNCTLYCKIYKFLFGRLKTIQCRNCFQKLIIKIDSITIGSKTIIPTDQFIFNSDLLNEYNKSKLKKSIKESKIPTSIGSSLPLSGTCNHYKKSYRWIRFPCCNNVYPCHICHDKSNPDHNSEWGKQMICGYCSREQIFTEKCKFCHLILIGNNSKSKFWEGGKGCRNPITLSNKDSHKYKLLNKKKIK
ncbi:hypothetical protein ACR3K2_34820 [Cryptosporidium serpentis]